MKDRVDIGHLTKYDAFRVNRDQVMDLKIWFKIHTNVANFETASSKTILNLKICYQFYTILHYRRGDSKGSNEPPLEVNNVDFHLLTNSGRIENKL